MFHKHKTHGIIITVITAILLLFCSSCNDDNIEPDSQAYAYLEIFKTIADADAEEIKIIEEEEGIEIEIEYIAVNLKNILYKRPSHIKKLIKDYAVEHDVQIIWTNRDKYRSSKIGYLLIFEDVELTETKLKTDVTWWAGDTIAECDNYTVENEAGEWTITNWEFIWIS